MNASPEIFFCQFLYLIQLVADLPGYDYSTSDEEDYLHPPSSRTQTPPPCYSDIFDSEDSVSNVTNAHNTRLVIFGMRRS